MSKRLLTLLIILFVSVCSFAGYYVPTSSTWNSGSGFVYTTNNVAVNQSSASTALDVSGDITADNYNATTGYYIGNNSLTTSLLSINTTSSLAAKFLNSTLADAGSVYMYFGKDTTSNGGFLQYYKATDGISTSNYIHMNHAGLSEGGIYVRGSDGNVGINKASPEAKLVVREPNVGQVAMRVQVDNTGIAGTVFIEFTRGGDTVVGGIVATSDTNVNYVNFAGAHYTETEDVENVQPFMVLESTGEIYEKYSKCFKTRICKTRKSSNAIGVYGGKTTDNMDMITCLGAGRIWVANKGENIEVGDYLMSSDIAGMSEKQDDDILHNYTIAKSSVGVVWEAGEESRLIACTLHGG